MDRNYTIDLIRLIAAFCIMTLHIQIPSFGHKIGSIIQLGSRWAVPFFFITTGYFLGKKILRDRNLNFNRIEKNVVNLISILIVSSFVYIIHGTFFSYQWFANDVSFLLKGSFWHLWFIGSMILGYVLIWYLYNLGFQRILPYLSVFILIIAIYSDSYDVIFHQVIKYNQIPRFLISIPFMYVGIFLSGKKNLKSKLSLWIVIFIIGFFMQYAEMVYFYEVFHYSTLDHQILIGTIVCAIAIFVIGLSVQIKSNPLSNFGEKYSLFIYLYHVIGYWFIRKVFRLIEVYKFDYTKLLMPIVGFVLMLAITILLDKYLHKIFSILNGNIK